MKLRIEASIPDESQGMPLQDIQVRDALDKLGNFASDHVGLIGGHLRVGERLGGWFPIFMGIRIDYTLTRIE